jgi:hypothetical protein
MPSLSLDYGLTYQGILHMLEDGRRLFCTREFEAWAGRPKISRGKSVEAVEASIARKGANPRDLEIELHMGDERR